MEIKDYLDATYLKTIAQSGLNASDYQSFVNSFVQEAIQYQFKLVMIRPQMVSMAKNIIRIANANVLVGTVIGFPEGTASLQEKLKEAKQAIDEEADELDFVINYPAFLQGDIQLVKEEVKKATQLCLQHKKTIKWIIEVAALNNFQIAQLSSLIKQVVLDHFHESEFDHIFVKSSTGFYTTAENQPNGATIESIKIMLENAYPLPIKAAGGVKNLQEAQAMIQLGVKRIGTSAAKEIIDGISSKNAY